MAEVTAGRAQECQDWQNERTWVLFTDGSAICVEGSSADERSEAEYREMAERT